MEIHNVKKVLLILMIGQLSFIGHAQVIADHNVVDLYDDIPHYWIDKVKTKLVWAMGMSHGYGYFRGAELLEQMDPDFQVDIWYNTSAPADQSNVLRLGRPGLSRESFWTSQSGIDHFNESTVTKQHNTGNPYDFIWFGWSYQGTWENGLGGGVDPIYDVQWAGSTQSGIDGNQRWGLDSEDSELTGNSVCMDTYLDAVEQYNQFYIHQDYETKFLFSNGVVDGRSGTELGFQRELKNQHVREYVNKQGDNNTYFLDYADILVHNADGELHTVNWDDNGTSRPHQQIHPDNLMDYDSNFNIISPDSDEVEDHIGEVGTVRLAKAMWWLLARASGWNGDPSSTSIIEDTGSSDSDIFTYADSDFIWINNTNRYMDGQIELYDLQGRLIEIKGINGDKCCFNTSSLMAGVYIVVISKDCVTSIDKVVLL